MEARRFGGGTRQSSDADSLTAGQDPATHVVSSLLFLATGPAAGQLHRRAGATTLTDELDYMTDSIPLPVVKAHINRAVLPPSVALSQVDTYDECSRRGELFLQNNGNVLFWCSTSRLIQVHT
ncbi:hypothetical protein EYF80_039945 [Liparis tanakae]|uniref:Uncharacterized protein n=1 Tax=Liparis tanakae TaxID=230148 RepID=A0A4Z2GB42_9TELE|nr:hypothetical protein EYF80_039945 [Liparis tanakae]